LLVAESEGSGDKLMSICTEFALQTDGKLILQQIVQILFLALTFAVSSCSAEQAIDSRLDAVGEMFRAEEIIATLVDQTLESAFSSAFV